MSRGEQGVGAGEGREAARLSIQGLTKEFPDDQVLHDVDLDVEEGGFCAVLGPSGSGKSVLLNCVAGLEEYEGTVEVDGEDVADVPVEDRGFGLVFQEFEETLFPHMSVEDNVAFGLRQMELDQEETDRRVDEILELLAISEIRDSSPEEISGGQQQRVELARQLVREPRLMLLDDPLADLDYKLQKRMELELRRIHRESGATYVYVTHNQDQALKLADQVVVVNRGRIEQTGSPDDVYYEPETAFVARFVGDSNMLAGDVEGSTVDTALGSVTVAEPPDGDRAVVLVRPEDVLTGDEADDADNRFEASLEARSYTGETTEFIVQAEGVDLHVLRPGAASLPREVEVGWDAGDAHVFTRLSVDEDVTVDDLRGL